MQKPTNGPENMDGGRMNRFLRTASFWALIVLIPLLIFQLMNSNREAQQELTYSEFRSQVQGGNVESVTIQEGRKLEGILRSSIEKNGVQVENFHTLLPFEADKALIDELEEAGVQSQGEGPGSNWVGLLVGVLPWLLIIGRGRSASENPRPSCCRGTRPRSRSRMSRGATKRRRSSRRSSSS
jgi:ATP-dependent Zn protease